MESGGRRSGMWPRRSERHARGGRGGTAPGRPRRRLAVAVASAGTLLIVGTLAAAFSQAPHARVVADDAPAAPAATSPSSLWTPARMLSATPEATMPATSATSATPSAARSAAGIAQASPVSPVSPTAARPAARQPAAARPQQPSASPEAAGSAAPQHATTVRPAPATAMTPYPRARSFAGTPAVGVLFYTDRSLAAHYCTASVVHSPAGDLVVTAAHCVYGSDYKTGIAFVPGYHDGQSPYGQWTPAQTIVSAGWRASNDPDEDVAFLVMRKSAAGQSVESVVGADQVAFGQGFGQTVTVPAYPAGSDSPITCSSVTSQFSATQIRWDCAGYPGGTSGAPLLVGGNRGTVVGVIGGYETGGDSPDVSYSSYFGGDIARLYQQAEAAG